MSASKTHSDDPRGPRERIVELLRREPQTVDDLCRELGVTANAVRVQLASLERDEWVRKVGTRPGPRRPAHVYALDPAAEEQLSRAYAPVLATLVHALQERLPEAERLALFEEVGRHLASGLPPAEGGAEARLQVATEVLRQLGGLAEVRREDDGTLRIVGFGCPIAAGVKRDHDLCRAVESLLRALTGLPLHERCDRADRPSCRFELLPDDRES